MATLVVCCRSEAGRTKFLEVRDLGLSLQITWPLGLGWLGECKVRSAVCIEAVGQR